MRQRCGSPKWKYRLSVIRFPIERKHGLRGEAKSIERRGWNSPVKHTDAGAVVSESFVLMRVPASMLAAR
jgi:hypothetical protein